MLAAERFFGSGKSKLLPAAKLLQCERTANLQKSGFKRPDIGGLHGSGRANALNVKLLLQLRHCKNAQAAGGFYRLQKRSRAEKAAFPGQAQGQLHAVIAGGNTALLNGDEITIDIPNRTLQLHISDEELAERLRHVKPLIKPRTPSLAKYAALVTSADRGAILEIPDAIDPVRQTR